MKCLQCDNEGKHEVYANNLRTTVTLCDECARALGLLTSAEDEAKPQIPGRFIKPKQSPNVSNKPRWQQEPQ